MQAATCRKLLVSSRAAVGWLSVLAPSLIGRAWGAPFPLDNEVKYAIGFSVFATRYLPISSTKLTALTQRTTSWKRHFDKGSRLTGSTFFSLWLFDAGIKMMCKPKLIKK